MFLSLSVFMFRYLEKGCKTLWYWRCNQCCGSWKTQSCISFWGNSSYDWMITQGKKCFLLTATSKLIYNNYLYMKITILNYCRFHVCSIPTSLQNGGAICIFSLWMIDLTCPKIFFQSLIFFYSNTVITRPASESGKYFLNKNENKEKNIFVQFFYVLPFFLFEKLSHLFYSPFFVTLDFVSKLVGVGLIWALN